jgi:hypothetical protein
MIKAHLTRTVALGAFGFAALGAVALAAPSNADSVASGPSSATSDRSSGIESHSRLAPRLGAPNTSSANELNRRAAAEMDRRARERAADADAERALHAVKTGVLVTGGIASAAVAPPAMVIPVAVGVVQALS